MTALTPIHYEHMSPTLLSEEAPIAPLNVDRPNAEWETLFAHLESRMGMMRNWRYSWWTYWATLAEYILPRRYHWLISANLMRKGNPINQAIIDSTAGLAMQICAAGMVDGLMPTTRQWFHLGPGTPDLQIDAEASAWYEQVEIRLETVLGQSNFYNIMAQVAQDEVVFGTAPVIMYEDSEDVIRCYAPCCGEYYLSAGARLSIDTLYREFTFTVAQIIEMFGLDACPQPVQKQWEAGGASLEMEYVVAHAIEPNFDLAPRMRGGKPINPVPGGFTYREVYWLRGTATPGPLSKRGFHERPFAAARWSTVSNDAYGRGPGMDALGDIKQLQLETLRKAEAIEKMVRPPMGADPSLKNEPSSIRPGDITYISADGGKKGFWPLFEIKPDLSAMAADLKEIQSRIDRCFLVDVFQAITQMEGVQPRNDLEINERRAEKLQRLGPVIGLWKTEFASPLIQRALEIMRRRGLLPPLPPSLKGVPLKIEYMDMVTMAQIGAETASMERTWQVAGNLSAGAKAAGVADPLRVLNLDKSIRIYSKKINYPSEGLYTEQEVAQHDQDREREAQAAQAAKQGLAAVQGAKTLSETQLGGGQSALGALLGAPASPGGSAGP